MLFIITCFLVCVFVVQHFVDKGLTPYSLYTYSVEASNDVGSTLSTDVVFRTPSGVPTSDIALQVSTWITLKLCWMFINHLSFNILHTIFKKILHCLLPSSC